MLLLSASVIGCAIAALYLSFLLNDDVLQLAALIAFLLCCFIGLVLLPWMAQLLLLLILLVLPQISGRRARISRGRMS
jgi:hypothetical protein